MTTDTETEIARTNRDLLLPRNESVLPRCPCI